MYPRAAIGSSHQEMRWRNAIALLIYIHGLHIIIFNKLAFQLSGRNSCIICRSPNTIQDSYDYLEGPQEPHICSISL